MDYRPVCTRTRSKREIAILEQYWEMKRDSGVSVAPNSKRLRSFNQNVGESSSGGLKKKRSLGVDGVEVIEVLDSDDDDEVVISKGKEGGAVDVDSVSDGESDEDVDVVSDDENDEEVSSAEGDDSYYESEFLTEESTEEEYDVELLSSTDEVSSEEEKEEETKLADNENDCKGEIGEVGLKRKRNANGDDLHSSCGQEIDNIIEKVSKEENVEVGLEEKVTNDGDDMHSSSALGTDVKSEQVWKKERLGNLLGTDVKSEEVNADGDVGLEEKMTGDGDDLHSCSAHDTDVRSEQLQNEERLGNLLEEVNADGDVGLEEKMTSDGDDLHSCSAHDTDVRSEQVRNEERLGIFLKGRINADEISEGKRTDDGDDMQSSSAQGTDVRNEQVRNEEHYGKFFKGRINADEDVSPDGKVTDDGGNLHSCSAHDTDVKSKQVPSEETLGIYPKGKNNASLDVIHSSSGDDINDKCENLGVAETVLAKERTGCDRSDLYKDERVWKKEERFGVGLKENRTGYARNRCKRSEGDSSFTKTKSTRRPKQKRVPTVVFQPPKVECLPLRFSFDKKQPTVPEKSDHEREVQNLFEEFDFVRAYDEASTDSKAIVNNFTRSDNKRCNINDEAYGGGSEKAIDSGRRIDLQKAFNKNESAKGNDHEMDDGASKPGFDKGGKLDMQSACEKGVEPKGNNDEKLGGAPESGFDKSNKLDMQSACKKGVEAKGIEDEMHGSTSESCFDKGSKLDVQSACEKGVEAKENNLLRSSNTQNYYKKKEDARKLTNKTESTAPKDCTAFTVLLDSIYDKGEVSGENFTPFADGPLKDEAPRDEAPTDEDLPKFFRLGPPPSPRPQKSAREIEEDMLYDEMIFAKMSEQIGSTDSKVVETNDSVPPGKELTQHELCCRGKHVLELDEQIGLLCKYCSHVHREIRYIVPDFAPNPCGKSGKNFYEEEDEDNRPNLEDLQCNDHNNSGFSSHALTEGTVWDLIPGVESDMYSHQREGFEFIWKHLAGGIQLGKLADPSAYDGDGCIISHAPGTGKTRLTIIFIQSYMNFNPSSRPLIVAPRTMLLTWEEEFKKWGFDIPFHNLNNPDFTGKEDRSARNLVKDGKRSEIINLARVVKLKSWAKTRSILGISYSLFEKICGPPSMSGKPLPQRRVEEAEQMSKILLEFPGLVVFDEGHNPRNDQSHSWNALLQLKTRRRILLSGTPFQNNFEELYNTVRLVRPEWIANLTYLGGFDKKQWSSYSNVKKGQLADDNTKRATEVRHMISPFVHVYKGTILQDKLPGLRNSVVVLQPTPLQQRYSDKTRQITNPFKYERVEAKVTIHPSLLLNEEPSTTSMFQEREYLADWNSLPEIKLNPEGGVKARFTVDLIRLCQAMKERVLVFSQWIDPLYLMRDLLMSEFHWREGDEIIYMDGKCDAKQRQSSMSVFNNPSTKAKVMLASTKGCNEGISLVGASRVVLLDVAWNPSVERQAISRAYRLGQKKVVYIYHLLMAGAREEDKYIRQVEKHRLSELVFSCSDAEAAKKIPAAVAEDKILEVMYQHEKLNHIFQSIRLLDEAKLMDEAFES